ncbi:MAG: hypothetical protein H7321_07120 [Bacteroidia bacterium]|nr:hypothetical protein [Bacteroidia bacterium]
MLTIPVYICILFILTTLTTVFLFYRAAANNNTFLLIISIWLAIQMIISLTGFYTVTTTIPPRFILLAGPPVLFIILLFITKKGRRFIDNLSLKTLTLIHVIRIPVEIVLLLLYIQKTVPKEMTFEGINFDVLSGITAPVIYYFVFFNKGMSYKILALWNIVCLMLLINIVTIAVLSAPFPFQKIGMDQPNIAVLYFPFIWLPCCVVPLVLFSHLASLRKIFRKTI